MRHFVSHAAPDIILTVVGVDATVVSAIANGRSQARRYVLPATGCAALRSHLVTFHRLQPDIVHLNLLGRGSSA